MANHVAKVADRGQSNYPNRLAQVCDFGSMSRDALDAVFAATAVDDVWGVGRKIARKLNDGGIQTVLDLVRSDVSALRRQFSVVLEKTVLELRGTPCLEVDDAPAANQQILVSLSFGKAVTDIHGIVEAISEFASRAAEKLRQQRLAAGAIQVFFMTSPFRANERQHHASLVVPLGRPTPDTRVLVAAANRTMRELFRGGFSYAKAGVMLIDLQPASTVDQQAELDLFTAPEVTSPLPQQDRPALMGAMDALNRRFGRDAVRIGGAAVASGGAEVRSWSVKQERRTPRYTTRWGEMPRVRA